MELKIPEFCLLVILGPENAGQALIKRVLPPPAYLDLEECNKLMGTQESTITEDSLELMLQIVGLRLKNRQMACVDGSQLLKTQVNSLLRLARKYHCRPIAISLDLPLEECLQFNAETLNPLATNLIRVQRNQHLDQAPHLREIGFRQSIHVQSAEELRSIAFQFQPLRSDQRHVQGPFDFVGDVHGCIDELHSLLEKLGYESSLNAANERLWHQAEGRKLVFVGDFCDRGPDTPGVYELVMELQRQGLAIAVPGNHDDKLLRKLSGRDVSLKHGLAETMEQLEAKDEKFKESIKEFIKNLPHHQLLEGGKYLVAHAGLKAEMHNRSSGEVQAFCLYGDTTGEKDEFGLPVRLNWAANYQAETIVVYGHTPVPEAVWQNNTINIDTGCVFGGKLTALRMPENQIVQVKAKKVYSEPRRPIQFVESKEEAQQSSLGLEWIEPSLLMMSDTGYTGSLNELQVRHVIAHLHYHAVDMRWLRTFPLPLLPPPQLPDDTLLESPQSAMNQLLAAGVEKVIARKSQSPISAVLVICKDDATAKAQFGEQVQGCGSIYDAFGKPLIAFQHRAHSIIRNISHHWGKQNIWECLQSDWIAVEVEVRPFKHFAETMIGKSMPQVAAASKLQQQFLEAHLLGFQLDSEEMKEWERDIQLQKLQIDRQAAYLAHLQALNGEIHFIPQRILLLDGKNALEESQEWHAATSQLLVEACPSLFQLPEDAHFEIALESEQRRLMAHWEKALNENCTALKILSGQSHLLAKGEWQLPGYVVRHPEYLRLLLGLGFDEPAQLAIHAGQDGSQYQNEDARRLAMIHEISYRLMKKRPFAEIFQPAMQYLGLCSTPRPMRFAN